MNIIYSEIKVNVGFLIRVVMVVQVQVKRLEGRDGSIIMSSLEYTRMLKVLRILDDVDVLYNTRTYTLGCKVLYMYAF